ncbi:hypothetical protein QQX98_007192 [Neonectria punicea]|uniref:Lipocalin/cytosolic fatty-acid binding domain-containing protein n=1 Tax=Neonectria punicea TaxID=979145 RepID=A0ABR1GYL7_9HYPO
MNGITLLVSLGLVLGGAQAISMIDYAPACGVNAEFGYWYSELLRNNEDPTTTTTYTNFYAPNGSLVVLGDTSTGADAILTARAAMLPSDGSIQWNHFPNTTTVAYESATEKTFQVAGIMQTVTVADGSCSTTDFRTLFTVTKNKATGKANLTPQGGSLLIYNGFFISPSDLPCTR